MRQPGQTQPPMFATAVYVVLDAVRGEICLANAGQVPPILWPAAGEPRYVRQKGLPLGALRGSGYEEVAVRLGPGDRLLFCSDGFIEEPRAGVGVVGHAGFLDRLKTLGDRREEELIAALIDSESRSGSGLIERDDRTLVLVMVT
jgi:serine phosphatase RsbU (regulator of sigma subunit)